MTRAQAALKTLLNTWMHCERCESIDFEWLRSHERGVDSGLKHRFYYGFACAACGEPVSRLRQVYWLNEDEVVRRVWWLGGRRCRLDL